MRARRDRRRDDRGAELLRAVCGDGGGAPGAEAAPRATRARATPGTWGSTATAQLPADVSARVGADLAREPLTPAQMVEARGVCEVDGNSNSREGTFWKLYSNSVMLKVDGEWEQW